LRSPEIFALNAGIITSVKGEDSYNREIVDTRYARCEVFSTNFFAEIRVLLKQSKNQDRRPETGIPFRLIGLKLGGQQWN